MTESPMSQSPEDLISGIEPDSVKCNPTRASPCCKYQTLRDKGMFQGVGSPSPPGTKKETIVKLIGKKALAQCNLNGLAVTALLDTGAQVSMIDRTWKDKYLPAVEVRPLAELMGMSEKLEVYAVNGELIPFDGWSVITVNLQGNDNPDLSINVPFLVIHIPIERPLLGFNVVEELIQGQPERLVPTLVSLLSSAIAVSSEQAQTLVSFVQTPEHSGQWGQLRISRDSVLIPAGQVAWVKCRVPSKMDQSGTVALFEPDEDNVHLEQLWVKDCWKSRAQEAHTLRSLSATTRHATLPCLATQS